MQPEQKTDNDNKKAADLKQPGRLAKFKGWFINHKTQSIPLVVVIIILGLALVPWSRYHAAGLVMKNDFSLQISDATAHFPVSGATISVEGIMATTDATGTVRLPGLSVGHHSVSIKKANYQSRTVDILVPILRQKQAPAVAFTATGRQVKITVKNLISQQPINGALVEIDGAKSLTDASGSTLAVVSAGSSSKQAAVSAPGYNAAKAAIEVSDSQVKESAVNLTPAGEVYFLSNQSGKLDVVKANLDGSGRQTVLAGTGKEDDHNTVLLASTDWHYLALLANRDGADKLYIINTADDSMLVMDQTNADFNSIGWHNHYFVYTVARHNYNDWQPNAFSIKSYNADTGKVITLANTNASGSGLADAQYENFWEIRLVGSDVVFSRTWYKYPGYLKVDGKQNLLVAIRPDGSNSRQLKAVDAANFYIANLHVKTPKQLEFTVTANDGSGITYFAVSQNGSVSSISQPKDIYDAPVPYLPSPSGEQTFWQDQRDGKNTLFVGNDDAAGAKQVASLSDFSAYGWYTDKYLLVSKNGSQLYIIPKTGVKDDTSAVKITDYHKPAQSFYGYGGL